MSLRVFPYDYDKYYPLTNGMYLRCDEYNYFYEYMPEVKANGFNVFEIGEEKVSGTVVRGRTIRTQIAGDWEGCDFDTHRLINGMYLTCNTYFYEYAYAPKVEILVIGGSVKSVRINGKERNRVTVSRP